MSTKYDIHFEAASVEDRDKGYIISFGDYARVIGVSGIQKMVNRFLKCLLTPAGSDISDRRYGTALASLFFGNVDPRTVSSIATRAVAEAEQKIREYDSRYQLPDDERLASAHLQNVAFDRASMELSLRIRLQNVRGTVVSVLLPTTLQTKR